MFENGKYFQRLAIKSSKIFDKTLPGPLWVSTILEPFVCFWRKKLEEKYQDFGRVIN
jgi:hypothetical protein